MKNVTAVAIDLGSSSGRVLAGVFDGTKIVVHELHRFAHEAQTSPEGLVWDLETMWAETAKGLRLAADLNPVSVSVDTWGVDVALLGADGAVCAPTWAYRDERTERTHAAFRALLPDEAAWSATGIQPATINTANQLVALGLERPEVAAQVVKVLWLPDYFIYKLSGVPGWSKSICSSSGMCAPGASAWSPEVLAATGINPDWLGPLTAELSVAGPCTVPGLEAMSVVRGGGHDTACAVHALPLVGDGVPSYFLSCGSWSLLGVERDTAMLDAEVYRRGITNEVRTDGGIRALFNVTGLWILQELQRQWASLGAESNIVELVELAAAAPSLGCVLDPDDPVFTAPGGMMERVTDYLTSRYGVTPGTQGELVRVVLESLAERYARGINDLNALTGRSAQRLHLVGGGSRNRLLCQLTASAAGVEVMAGPAEASALGAIIAQLETLGVTKAAERAELVRASADFQVYQPDNTVGSQVDWAGIRQRFAGR